MWNQQSALRFEIALKLEPRRRWVANTFQLASRPGRSLPRGAKHTGSGTSRPGPHMVLHGFKCPLQGRKFTQANYLSISTLHFHTDLCIHWSNKPLPLKTCQSEVCLAQVISGWKTRTEWRDKTWLLQYKNQYLLRSHFSPSTVIYRQPTEQGSHLKVVDGNAV